MILQVVQPLLALLGQFYAGIAAAFDAFKVAGIKQCPDYLFDVGLFEFAQNSEAGVAVPVARHDPGTAASGKDLRHFSGADAAAEKFCRPQDDPDILIAYSPVFQRIR